MNIDAGHMTKGNAIAYMPLVLAGIRIALYKNRWLGRFWSPGIAMSMEVTANHLTDYVLFVDDDLWFGWWCRNCLSPS
jgi:hypothetical protein